ncbi:MAG: kynureninase [Candidatus Azotimanducaceae bacterium]|jgi:kynureninase
MDSNEFAKFDISEHYQAFSVRERTLLTGHSHQAWPDCAQQGLTEAWQDAAESVDDKWDKAFKKADKLKQFYAQLVGDLDHNNYVLAQNTHDLLIRFLSALDWKKNKRIVTTDGEFHSMRRQLSRLEEEGIEISRISVSPADTLCERIVAEIDDNTTAVMISAVMFKNATIIPNIALLGEICSTKSIPLLVDVYHALNAIPFNIKENGLDEAYLVGGGYKYCQFGEGNCFMRIPNQCDLRPVVTGWYAEFGTLEQAAQLNITQYPGGGDRFQGSTYDPISHYRACSVIDFFEEMNLTPSFLRALSQHQIGILRNSFDALDCDKNIIQRADVPLESIAGFLSLKTNQAASIQKMLKERSIWTDQRDGFLRFGPAPYLSELQLKDAMLALGELL